jgi:hypothetical protein
LGQGFIRPDVAARQLKIGGECRTKGNGAEERRDDAHRLWIFHWFPPSRTIADARARGADKLHVMQRFE